MMRSLVSLSVEFEIERRRQLYKQAMFSGKVLGEAKNDRSLVASVKKLINRFSKRA